MDLPRIASHTSLSVPQLELLHYSKNINANRDTATSSSKSRTTVSKRLLNAAAATTTTPASTAGNDHQSNSSLPIPQITINPPQLTITAHLQPSRKREEATALRNLKKRVQQLRVVKANQQFDNDTALLSTATRNSNLKDVPQQELDNRPHLLQRILIQRPVSMVLDADEFQTAWQDSDFISDCLCWHNVYRQRHGAQPLTMSPELCDYAQTWANHLAHTNTFYYRNDRDVGQNLFCRPANALQTDVSGQEVSSYWYSAVRQYDYGKEPDVLHANVNAGHFTQLVWANSQYFGIGKARSRSGKVLVVANYSPPGNISGLFEENVLPPQPEPSNVTLQVPLCYDHVHQQHTPHHGGNNSASGGASCSDTTDTESRSSNSGTSFGIR